MHVSFVGVEVIKEKDSTNRNAYNFHNLIVKFINYIKLPLPAYTTVFVLLLFWSPI